MKTTITTIGLLAVSLLLAVAPANATVVDLIEVSGSEPDFVAIDAGEASGFAFTLDNDYSSVSILADVFCLGCSGRFVLTREAIGPETALADLVFAADYTGGSALPLLIGETLSAATYFLTLIIDTGTAGWSIGDNANFFEAPDANYGLNYFSDNADTTFPPRSSFEALFGISQYVRISGEQIGGDDPQSVPVPATLGLLLLGLCLGLRRRA